MAIPDFNPETAFDTYLDAEVHIIRVPLGLAGGPIHGGWIGAENVNGLENAIIFIQNDEGHVHQVTMVHDGANIRIEQEELSQLRDQL